MGELTGEAAIVTGSAEGIGYGIALELARAGCAVIIADRNVDAANAAALELQKASHDAIAVALDVIDAASVDNCVSESIDHFRQISILVNNAGIHCEAVGRVTTVEEFTRCFDVNLYGVWRMTQALLPHFRKHKSGRVINIASINGRKPWADTPAYSASKAALISLTQSLALKLGSEDINVNAVCPGGVMTRMADAFAKDRQAFLDGILSSRILKRPLSPEDIGHAVVFLASRRSRNITGQALNVDGGEVMS